MNRRVQQLLLGVLVLGFVSSFGWGRTYFGPQAEKIFVDRTLRQADLPTESSGMQYIQMMTEVQAEVPLSCPDISANDFVNLEDFTLLAESWLETGTEIPGDFDDSGEVNIEDLAHLAGYWLSDPQCARHYSDSLPYLTSFEDYQGYTTDPNDLHDLDFQMGWEVESGSALVDIAGWWVPELQQYVPYQVIYVDETTAVSKEFDDEGSDHNYIRFHVVPGCEAEILVVNDSDVVAGVKFGTNWNIYVLDNGTYADTGVDYYDRWYYGYWTDLKLKMNWSSDTYEVYWNADANDIADDASFDADYSVLTHVKFETADDWMAVNRLSISDFASGDLITSIDKPCHCDIDEGGISESRVPVIGHVWWETLGVYQIMFCPTDLDFEEIENWTVADAGVNVVDYNDRLGYWHTGSIPNGFYYLGIVVYSDIGLSEGFWLVVDEYDNPAPVAVNGDLKTNTFHQVEDPDISVPWPGQFPFEFKRIYDNSRKLYKKPLRNGWTHNSQIMLEEDARYYYEGETGWPFEDIYHDDNLLGFGFIYVTYPDGSRHMFRRSSSGSTYNDYAEYVPYPKNGKTEVLTRCSYVDGYDYIYRVTYELELRDGTTINFQHDFNPDISVWSNGGYGIKGWKAKAHATSMSDRFGNTLNFSWNSAKTSVTQVNYGSGATARAIKFYDDDSDGYYEEARLVVGTDVNNPYRVVTFDWDSNDLVFTVSHLNEGVDEDGDYITDANDVKSVFKYGYDGQWNLRKVVRGENLSEPAIEVNYDSWARVASRKDYVDSGSVLETNYSYSYYHPDTDDVYADDPNETGEDDLSLKTTQTNVRQTVIIVQNENGAQLAQKIVPADQSATKEILYEYEDNNNPLQPSETREYFDDYLRRTANSYDNHGDLTLQIVYDDANSPVRTEFAYHPDYSLLTRKTTWQEPNEPSAKIETLYVYGKNYGTIDGSVSANNKYLIAEKVLLDTDPNTWAETTYEYATNGLVTEKIDPENHRTVYEYDTFNYPKWVKVGSSGSEEKLQRFSYDAIGQKLLESNHLGGVNRYDIDDHGRLYRQRTYSDSSALTINDATFIPSRYDGFTALSDERFGFDTRGNRTYEKKSDIGTTTGGKIITVFNRANLPETVATYEYDDGTSAYVEVASVEYTYDSRGLKTQELRTDQVNSADWKITYDYDDEGRLTDTWRYDYDDQTLLKHIASVYYGSGQKQYEQVYGTSGLEAHTSFSYDIFDRLLERVVDPNGLDLTTTYAL